MFREVTPVSYISLKTDVVMVESEPYSKVGRTCLQICNTVDGMVPIFC